MGQKTLGMAVSELDDLQRRHKQGMRLEARALANHSKMLSTYTNVRSSLEEAKKRYEVMEGRVRHCPQTNGRILMSSFPVPHRRASVEASGRHVVGTQRTCSKGHGYGEGEEGGG